MGLVVVDKFVSSAVVLRPMVQVVIAMWWTSASLRVLARGNFVLREFFPTVTMVAHTVVVPVMTAV
jgi:hypothetical protein